MSLSTQKPPIEIKLQLTGHSANDETLHDLLTWLEQEDIEGLTLKRQEVPSIPEKMGGPEFYVILAVILATPPALESSVKIVERLLDSLSRWINLRDSDVSDILIETSQEELEFQKEIKALREKQEAKRQKRAQKP